VELKGPLKGEDRILLRFGQRFRWLWVVVCLCLLPVNPATIEARKERRGTIVKVLTFNIHHGADHQNRLNLDRIRQAIEQADADVVTLQEVDKHWSDRSHFVDQAAWLGEQLGMKVRFAPIYSLDPLQPGYSRREYGLAVLSRYPIIRFSNHELSRISSQEPEKGVQSLPGFPEAVINAGGTKMHVFTTHLSWMDPELRLKEADEMMAFIRQAHYPVILTGDMNAVPDSPEIQRIRDHLTDAFEEKGEGNGMTYPVPQPVRRIDYIFASSQVKVLQCYVLQGEGSDHYGVQAELWIPKEEGMGNP
jgi:endonuclease/exonuclease/phosphatase family metal-dependent hydrolase